MARHRSAPREDAGPLAHPREDAGPRLEWAGRSWAPGPKAARSAPLRGVELVGDGAHRLVHGDVLDLTGALAAEGRSVDLVYVDPPYASERDYVAEARLDGPADGRVVRTKAYGDIWSPRSPRSPRSTRSPRDGGLAAYLDMLAPRLEALAGLLGPRGTFWVHLDWRAAYLVRAILDEIMGRDAFKNEIVWRRAPNLGRQAASGQFGRTLDTILVYGMPEATIRPPTRLEPIEPAAIKWDDEGRPFTSAPRGDYTDASIARLEREGRVHRSRGGKVYIKYFLVKNDEGVLCRERRVDALWTDIAPVRHAVQAERTGYPTQKPRALIERIVACATEPGGVVVDAFAGSGTTGVAAHRLGRRAILGDASAVAVATARARLLREGAGVSIERAASTPEPPRAKVRLEVAGGSVRLIEPEEPLAWSVGRERDGVLHSAWHTERTPGGRPVPAKREAHVSGKDELVARVWCDDGSVTTVACRASRRAPRARGVGGEVGA